MGLRFKPLNSVSDLLDGSEREEAMQRAKPFGVATAGQKFTRQQMYERHQAFRNLSNEAFELYRRMPMQGSFTVGEIRQMQDPRDES